MNQKAKVHDPASVDLKVGKIVMASPEELDSLDVDKPTGEFTFNSQNLTPNLMLTALKIEPTDTVVTIANPATEEKIAEILYNGDVKLYGTVTEAARIFWDWVKLYAEADIKRLIAEGKIIDKEVKDESEES